MKTIYFLKFPQFTCGYVHFSTKTRKHHPHSIFVLHWLYIYLHFCKVSKIMAANVPNDLSLEEIRDFMLKNGGKVTNLDLVKHFKRFLTNPNTQGQ